MSDSRRTGRSIHDAQYSVKRRESDRGRRRDVRVCAIAFHRFEAAKMLIAEVLRRYLGPMTGTEHPEQSGGAGAFPPVLTTAMAAELLQVHVEYLRRMVREGRIPCHRFPGGREMRFLRDELIDWLAALPGEDQSTSTVRTQANDPIGT
jgi:excisionase family DNA binding protein